MSHLSELVQGVIKGVLLSLWIIGSLMMVMLLLKKGSQFIVRRRRFGSLNGSNKDSGTFFSLKGFRRIREFSEEMDIAEMKISVEFMLSIMLVFILVAFLSSNTAVFLLQQKFATGSDRFAETNSWLISCFVAFLSGAIPYFYVRFRVQRKRHRIAYRMIMLVQNLIGHYRPSITIAEVIVKSSRNMPDEVRNEWRRLELSMHMQSIDEALFDFARRINNAWGDDLIDLLLIGTHYGSDITDTLHHLVIKMQKAKRNEENRLAMITVYRIGTIFMVLFALFVVIFNIYADGANYHHYFVDPTGKAILIISVIVMFISMVLVVRSGQKQF
jgi:Flp pilus assembly protein TadB